MSRRNDGIHEEHTRVFTAHEELLEFTIREQLGPLAESLVRTLNRNGPMTLKDLADTVKREPFNNPLSQQQQQGQFAGDVGKQVRSPIAVPVSDSLGDIATDAAIKELMTRLLLHRVVQHDGETHTYSVALGYGLLLRTLFPLIVQFFQRRYGETGVTLLMVFYQLAAVPFDVAMRLAMERRPALTEALRHCAREMERLGLIECVSAETPSSSHAQTPTPTPSLSASPDPCRLHAGHLLCEMLRDVIHRELLAGRHPDGGVVAAALMDGLTAASRARRLEMRPAGFPPAPPRTSPALPLRALLRELPHTDPAVVVDTVSRMCRPDGDAVLSNDGTSSAAMEGPYRFRYDNAVEAMRRDCCERLVFARHGVLGVRIVKLLLMHHNMEDRMLAEEAIATLPRTREVLHAMMRDGYVRQQEVPKSGVMADRQPKNSIFLWSCSMEGELLPTVRVQVAKALRNVLERLAMERQTLVAVTSVAGVSSSSTSSSTTTAAATTNTTTTTMAPTGSEMGAGLPSAINPQRGTAEAINEMLRCRRAVAALESSASSLMGMMLVLDFY
ncbi:uncharacterized protein TM35_000391120 [Trypanosoma theileri]|uniref:DNA-directed RNA polymerase III subunit RPC3 n=1 Tax=Trypanosoma theileri TaxID=67003 RepID=A0A1X0NK92_9TRYP|nr:uncharacterized protein TM35_000391120 [Trypanosoma theileri]ORC84938.1 hypothetical protein TM35_000391120 [Trypanosoma theileri]